MSFSLREGEIGDSETEVAAVELRRASYERSGSACIDLNQTLNPSEATSERGGELVEPLPIDNARRVAADEVHDAFLLQCAAGTADSLQ